MKDENLEMQTTDSLSFRLHPSSLLFYAPVAPERGTASWINS
ncbi:hypothetical protein BH18ACI2_BH18ACI2_07340 [soil metagenome]